MLHTNFCFLENFDPILLNLGQEIEKYVLIEPNLALFKERAYLERLIKEHIFINKNLDYKNKNLNSLTEELEKMIHKKVSVYDLTLDDMQIIKIIRQSGNRAVHGNYADENQAKKNLDSLLMITKKIVNGSGTNLKKQDIHKPADISYFGKTLNESDIFDIKAEILSDLTRQVDSGRATFDKLNLIEKELTVIDQVMKDNIGQTDDKIIDLVRETVQLLFTDEDKQIQENQKDLTKQLERIIKQNDKSNDVLKGSVEILERQVNQFTNKDRLTKKEVDKVSAEVKKIKKEKSDMKKIVIGAIGMLAVLGLAKFLLIDSGKQESIQSERVEQTTKKEVSKEVSTEVSSEISTSISSEPVVYMATKSGTKYHFDKNCKGLRTAKNIEEATELEAIELGLDLCGYEN